MARLDEFGYFLSQNIADGVDVNGIGANDIHGSITGELGLVQWNLLNVSGMLIDLSSALMFASFLEEAVKFIFDLFPTTLNAV